MKSVVQNSKLSLLPTGFHLHIHVKVHKSDLAQKMLLSRYIYIKKKSTGGSKVKRKEKTLKKNFRQVVLTLPWRQEKKHRAVQARRSEQHSSIVLAIPALGPE